MPHADHEDEKLSTRVFVFCLRQSALFVKEDSGISQAA